MKKRFQLMMCVLFFAGALNAGTKDDAGTYAGQFLKLGAGARSAGMGEAYCAVDGAADIAPWNPAGLAGQKNASISVMHALWLDDTSYQWFSFACPTKIGVFGVSAQYLSYGSITETDSTGLNIGSFSPKDMMAGLAYAGNVFKMGLGINIKYISSQIKNTATAYAADLGIKKKLGGKFTAGLAVQNVGTKLKYITEEEALPVNTKLGGSFKITDKWIIALDINAPQDNDINYAVGTEKAYKVDDDLMVCGRLGYNTKSKDTGGLNGAAVGLGASYKSYGIDYAFAPYGELGNTQKVSLTIQF